MLENGGGLRRGERGCSCRGEGGGRGVLEGDGGVVGERERGAGEGDGVRNPKACIYMCVLVTGPG